MRGTEFLGFWELGDGERFGWREDGIYGVFGYLSAKSVLHSDVLAKNKLGFPRREKVLWFMEVRGLEVSCSV